MPVAIVTGASGGIGLKLAELLAQDHHDLVLVARSGPALQQVAGDLERRYGICAWPVTLDLARPGSALQLMKTIGSLPAGNPEILVNNAGFGRRGAFAESPPDRNREMIELNITALVELTRLLLPRLLQRGRGRILNVASTAAFQPGPLMAVYYATKAFVLSFSLALSVELEGTGITCTALCPGPTATGFQEVAGMAGTAQTSRMLAMDASSVARAGYRALMRGEALVTPGVLNRIGAFMTRLAPRRLAARVAWLSQRSRGPVPRA